MTTSARRWLRAHDDRDAWAAAADLAPQVFASFGDLERAASQSVPDDLLLLCRARIRSLLGTAAAGPDAGRREREVAHWATADLYDERDRACLSFCEQFVLDVTLVDQPMVDELLRHLAREEVVALAAGLWFEEAMARLELALGARRPRREGGDR